MVVLGLVLTRIQRHMLVHSYNVGDILQDSDGFYIICYIDKEKSLVEIFYFNCCKRIKCAAEFLLDDPFEARYNEEKV